MLAASLRFGASPHQRFEDEDDDEYEDDLHAAPVLLAPRF
jgi:hypothetical protein